MTTLLQHTDFLTRRKVERGRVETDLRHARERESEERERAVVFGEARDVVNSVMLVTQEQVRSHIEDIASLALGLVYGDGYSLELDYEVKRNQTEITPYLVKCGHRSPPKDAHGGGTVDVCSFALRLALWSLMNPRPAPVFILDEPGKFISRDKQPMFAAMLNRLSIEMLVQIIMVSHAGCIMEQAEVAYEVTQTSGVSRATLVKGDVKC